MPLIYLRDGLRNFFVSALLVSSKKADTHHLFVIVCYFIAGICHNWYIIIHLSYLHFGPMDPMELEIVNIFVHTSLQVCPTLSIG